MNKIYAVSVNLTCIYGRWNDVYTVSAKNETMAKVAATQRVFNENDGVTEVIVTGVCEEVER